MIEIRKRSRKRSRGQATIEYIIMVAFGAIFSLQVVNFFDEVLKDGLRELESTVETETRSGQGFVGN